MVIIDTVINTMLGGLTLDPAGMHCPSWDDAFVSSLFCILAHRLSSSSGWYLLFCIARFWLAAANRIDECTVCGFVFM